MQLEHDSTVSDPQTLLDLAAVGGKNVGEGDAIWGRLFINNFTPNSRYIGNWMCVESRRVEQINTFETRPILLKSLKKWLSYRQIKFESYQKNFTGHLTKKGEKIDFEYAN